MGVHDGVGQLHTYDGRGESAVLVTEADDGGGYM